MAHGDGPDDTALRDAWRGFCDRLQRAGDLVFKDHNPPDAATRVDALRFLTQNLGQAFDLALETRDAAYPLLHPFVTPTRKLGGDCADFTYHQAWIDGAHVYRLAGTRGTAPFLNVTVQGPRPERLPNGAAPLHEPFGDVPEANLLGHEIEVDAAGRFELHIGGERRSANWLPTTPGSRKLFIRQGFDSWDEEPAQLSIERVGLDAPRPLLDPPAMIAAIDWAGGFLARMMADWPDWPFANGGVDVDRPNAFPAGLDDGGDTKRGRAAANMHWALGPDEALIVEMPVHDGLWMLTNMGPFFNSMDYLYRPVSYTPARTAIDRDGMIRLVLAHDDPGIANWIDTQAFPRGNLTYRHMLAGAPAAIATRLVSRDGIDEAMPDAPRVSAADRVAQLRARFDGVRRRYRL